MCFFKCFRKKNKNKQKEIEKIIINDKQEKVVLNEKEIILDDEKIIKEKKEPSNLKNINALNVKEVLLKEDEDAEDEVDTSKDFERVMARNAAVKMIQADLDMKNAPAIEKKGPKSEETDKKKNFEALFKKDK